MLCGDIALNPGPITSKLVCEIFLDEALAVGSLQGNLKDLVCTRGLKIFHLNVRSLNGKIDELRSILSTLSYGIHLLTLSETWLSSDIVDSEIDIVGYKLYRTDRKIRGRGVAVYVRDDICTIRRVDLESPDVEPIWLQVNLPKSHAFNF